MEECGGGMNNTNGSSSSRLKSRGHGGAAWRQCQSFARRSRPGAVREERLIIVFWARRQRRSKVLWDAVDNEWRQRQFAIVGRVWTLWLELGHTKDEVYLNGDR
jgi:hypothetical protein